MTQEQFERWRDFASRMANTCFRTRRRPNALWIKDVVADWFDRFDEADIPCVVDWDNSSVYPEGNPRRGRAGWLSYCDCDGRRSQAPDPQCEECHGRGVHYALLGALCVGDMVSGFLDDYRGEAPRCRACNDSQGQAYSGADCRCEDIDQLFREQWDDQWGGPVCCCIRAGLDCASAPSAGVVGFTAGDLRAMYPEGVPAWVMPPDEKLMYAFSNPPRENGTFAELPDDAGLVL